MPVLVAIFFFGIYFFSTNQIFSFDAVTNAIACDHSELVRWFHPNHLFYPFLGALWSKIERLFSYEGYAIYSLARLNSLLAATGLGFFFSALTQFLSKKRAFAATAALGSTYAVWHYAVDGRAIGITIFFSSLILWYLFRMISRDIAGPRDAVMISELSSLYIFSHAIGVFHIVPLAWLIRKKTKTFTSLLYLVQTISTVGLIYLVIYFSVIQGTPSSFFSWGLGYAGRLGAREAANSPFWAKSASDVLEGLWNGWTNALIFPENATQMSPLIFSNAMSVLFVVALILSFRKIKKHPIAQQWLFYALFTWGVLVTIFLAFWSPGQEGFRLHVLIPWAAALFLAYKDSRRFFQIVPLCAALIFSFNLSGPIYRNAFIENNQGFQNLREIQTHLKPGDVLVIGTSAAIADYDVLRPYFFPTLSGGTLSGWLLLSRQNSFQPLIEDYRQRINAQQKVYWAQDIFDTTLQQTLEKNHNLQPGAVAELVDSFGKTMAFTLSNGLSIYEITKKNYEPK